MIQIGERRYSLYSELLGNEVFRTSVGLLMFHASKEYKEYGTNQTVRLVCSIMIYWITENIFLRQAFLENFWLNIDDILLYFYYFLLKISF
jgi:hypothetical protein